MVASWRQPSATCTQGSPTYSSLWVGLGGYALNSRALEQIGSEVDCTIDGRVASSAWYELVPAPSRSIHMTVSPGDELTARVSVTGHRVLLEMTDLTRHTTFTRTVQDRTIDVTSADWILEAPSECSSSSQCQTLNLANFGSAGFSRASATTTRRQTASISGRHWGLTKIILSGGQRHFIGGGPSGPQATPSALVAGGSAFTVTYSASSGGAPTETTSLREARRAAAAHVRAGGARVG